MTFRTGLFVLVCLLPIGLYFYWVLAFATNVPFFDDFAILDALVRLEKARSPAEWLTILTAPHNEHRIGSLRLLSFLASRLNGGVVNLTTLTFLGNLSLLGLLALFWRVHAHSGLPGRYFLPVPFLVFQMQFFENAFWPMAAVQNLSILGLACTAFYLLTRPGRVAFGGALALASLSVYTSGNGLFVLPVGLLVVLVQRRWQAGVVWLLSSGALVLGYFSDYVLPGQPTPDSPADLLGGFFGFLGAFAGRSSGVYVSIGAGLVLLGSMAAWLGYEWRQGRFHSPRTLFWTAVFGWIVLTGIAVVSRRNCLEISSLSRYKVYTMLLLVLTYLAWLPTLMPRRQTVWFGTYLLGSLLFWASTQYRIPYLFSQHRCQLRSDAFNWQHTPPGAADPLRTRLGFSPLALLDEARQAGLYQLPEVLPVPGDSLWRFSLKPSVVRVRLQNQTSALGVSAPASGAESYLLLASSRRTYLFPLNAPFQSPWRWAKARGHPSQELATSFSALDLEPGSYRLALYRADGRPAWSGIPERLSVGADRSIALLPAAFDRIGRERLAASDLK